MNIQVIRDTNGNSSGVYIPISDWDTLVQKHLDLKQLVNISPAKFAALADKLDSFVTLAPNWDSYNADAISEKAIGNAKHVIDYLNANANVFYSFEINIFPMRDGGVQLEFDNENQSFEMEIDVAGKLVLVGYNKNGDELFSKELSLHSLNELASLTTKA